MKIRDWVYWVFLIGYCTTVFFLTRGIIVLALVLEFLPLLALGFVGHSVYTKMSDYLSFNYPQVLGRIVRELNFVWQNPFRLFPFDVEIEDPYFKELRNKYRKILWVQIFFTCACTVTFIYNLVTTGL